MFHQRESNPHFHPRPLHPYPQSQPTPPQPQPQPQPQHGSSNLHIPDLTHPQSRPPPSQSPPPRVQPPPQSRPPGPSPPINHQGDPHFQSSSLSVPPQRKTKRFTWLVAIFCVLFWVIIIVGGLVFLIVYLAYRPRLPKFDVSNASLNAAYLDMGYLLNSDMTLLVNFTNPNKKVNVDFSYVVINLYFEGTLIATRYIHPLSVASRNYKLADVHMLTSQVVFSRTHSQHFRRQIESGRVSFQIKGFFRTTSRLGSFMRYSYWLHGHCNFVVSGPPSGVMIAKKCVTKR